MKKLVFIVVLMSIFVFEVKCQSGDVPPNAQSGKCYAKCTMPESTLEQPILAWEEVLCADKINSSVVSDIVNALVNKGYKIKTPSSTMNVEVKEALTKFQKTFNLPIGNLNIKTLDALGVRY